MRIWKSSLSARHSEMTIWKSFGARDSQGIWIVPFGGDKKEITLPWKGLGDTRKLWENLLSCVKARQTPACPIDMSVRVQAPLSMGIISHRENKVVGFDSDNQTLKTL